MEKICTYGNVEDEGNTQKVVFPYHRLMFSVHPTMADDNITVLYHEYNVIVRGTVVKGTGDVTVVPMITKMRSILGQSGLTFQAHFSDVVSGSNSQLLRIVPGGVVGKYTRQAGEIICSDWGPQIENLTFDQIAGGEAANYQFSLRARTHDCFASTTATIPIENRNMVAWHTFNSHFHTDSHGILTRTVQGRYQVTTHAIRTNPHPERFRETLLPEKPAKFLRVRNEWGVDPDGLTVNYSVTDQERHHIYPGRITGGSVQFSMNFTPTGGLMVFTIQGNLEAPKDVPFTELVSHIANIIEARTPLNQSEGGVQIFAIPQQYELSRDLFENRVSFSARFTAGIVFAKELGIAPIEHLKLTYAFGIGMLAIGDEGGAGVGDHNPLAAQHMPPVNGHHPVPAKIKLGAWPACSKAVDVPSKGYYGTSPKRPLETGGGGGGSVTRKPDTESPSPTVTPAGTGSSSIPLLTGTAINNASIEHQQAHYLEYMDEISYEIDNNIVVLMPKAKGGDPIIQQKAPPCVHIIQAGYAKRLTRGTLYKPVPPPLPPDACPRQSYVSLPVILPVLDGANSIVKIKWRYVTVRKHTPTEISKKGISTDDKLLLKFPADPRLPISRRDEKLQSDHLPDLIYKP